MSLAPRSLAFMGQRKADGMSLGHVRAHEDDAVAVGEVLLIGGRRAASEGGAEPGHRGAVADPGLVFDGDDAQSAAEELFDQVVLLVVEGGAAERAHGDDVVELEALFGGVAEAFLAGFLDASGDAVHGPVERFDFPVIGIRGTVQHMGFAVRIDRKLKDVGAFGAEAAFVDGAFGVAFDVDDFAVFGVDVGAAADGAIGADAVGDGGPAEAGVFGEGLGAEGLRRACGVAVGALAKES